MGHRKIGTPEQKADPSNPGQETAWGPSGTREMILLSAGHKATASDHPHPTFSNDGTRIEIQSAMLSEDNKSMNICIIPVPETWLKKTPFPVPHGGKLIR